MRAVSMAPLLDSPHRHRWHRQTIRHLIAIGDTRRARKLARRYRALERERSQPRTPPASPALRPVSSASSNGDGDGDDSGGDDSGGGDGDGESDSQGPALRPSDAATYCGFSRTTLWRLLKARAFPKPFNVTEGCVVWRRAVLDRWLASRQANGPASTTATMGLKGKGGAQ